MKLLGYAYRFISNFVFLALVILLCIAKIVTN